MDKMTQFFAGVMGVCLHEWEHKVGQIYKCKKCGKIGSPDPVTLRFKADWTPSLNDPDFRKWWTEHEPEVYGKYLDECESNVVFGPNKYLNAIKVQEAQLNLTNLYDYLKAHFDQWAYVECTGSYAGAYCKYPAVKEMMEGEG